MVQVKDPEAVGRTVYEQWTTANKGVTVSVLFTFLLAYKGNSIISVYVLSSYVQISRFAVVVGCFW